MHGLRWQAMETETTAPSLDPTTAEQYRMNMRVEVHFRAPCMKDADITNGSSKVLWV